LDCDSGELGAAAGADITAAGASFRAYTNAASIATLAVREIAIRTGKGFIGGVADYFGVLAVDVARW